MSVIVQFLLIISTFPIHRSFCKTSYSYYSNIKLNLLISHLPFYCQIKICTTQLESHNLQESPIPIEIIRTTHVPTSFNSLPANFTDIFGFLPTPSIRSNCHVNFFYSKLWHTNSKTYKEDKRKMIVPYLLLLSKLAFKKTEIIGSKSIPYISYNIIISNTLKFTLKTNQWTVGKKGKGKGKRKGKVRNKAKTPIVSFDRNYRYAVLGFARDSFPVMCAKPMYEINIYPKTDCINLTSFYNLFPPSYDLTISGWQLSMDKLLISPYEGKKIYQVGTTIKWLVTNNVNPFDTEYVMHTMARILVQKFNGSINLDLPNDERDTKRSVGQIEVDIKFISERENLIKTYSDLIKLFSCYEKPRLSFSMYISPFDYGIWVCIVSSAALLWIIFYLSPKVLIPLKSTSSFSKMLFILGALIDDAYFLPQKLKPYATFKLLVIIWSLNSMLLSSCYNSFMVVELNSPLKGQSLSSTDEVFCAFPSRFIGKHNVTALNDTAKFLLQFWRYIQSVVNVTDKQGYLDGVGITEQKRYLSLPEAQDCFATISIPAPDAKLGNFGLNWNYKDFYRILEDIVNGVYNASIFQSYGSLQTRHLRQLYKFTSPLNRHFFLLDDVNANHTVSPELLAYLNSTVDPKIGETALEWDVLNTPRIAVVGPELRLRDEIAYLKLQYGSYKNCYLMDGYLFNVSYGWLFYETGRKRLFFDFRQMQESGIYSALIKNEKYRNQLKRKMGTNLIMKNITFTSFHYSVRPLNLGGSIQTIFFLYVILLISSFITVLVEVYHLQVCSASKTRPAKVTNFYLRNNIIIIDYS